MDVEGGVVRGQVEGHVVLVTAHYPREVDLQSFHGPRLVLYRCYFGNIPAMVMPVSMPVKMVGTKDTLAKHPKVCQKRTLLL